ncbi:hypothetical protein Taro_017463, partial [Colocasia esculenta]|nr:hypothetical protein [Colocasia esculenta]
ALVVGGTDTSSRHWSPASPFPVPHSSEPRPGSLEVSGMGLRPCGPQVVFPTKPVTREAHPYPPQVKARRTFLDRHPVQSRVVAVQGQHLQQCSVKEEDGEVDNNFSKVVVGQRWRNRSRVLPDSPLFHQGIDVIIAISRGI